MEDSRITVGRRHKFGFGWSVGNETPTCQQKNLSYHELLDKISFVKSQGGEDYNYQIFFQSRPVLNQVEVLEKLELWGRATALMS